ncbi:MAG: rod shape-determining protein MreC [Alphaproteobacteria bacterium]
MTRRSRKDTLQAVTIRSLALRLTPAALILFSLTLMVFYKIDSLPVERLRVAMTDFMAPVMSAVSKPFATVGDSVGGIRTMRELKAENIRLREDNAKLQQWYEAALKLQAQNQSFRELLNVKADPALVFVTARIVSDPGGAFVKSVLLPVGSSHNVTKGNAVMSGHGLIGRVVEAGTQSSRVLLITDLNSRIPVMVQDTRTRAILAGRNTDLLRLERLPIDSGLSVGQRIVTSGDGGQLPPDIPIGTIVDIGPQGVLVRPLTAIEKVTYVQVINTSVDQALVTGTLQVSPSP